MKKKKTEKTPSADANFKKFANDFIKENKSFKLDKKTYNCYQSCTKYTSNNPAKEAYFSSINPEEKIYIGFNDAHFNMDAQTKTITKKTAFWTLPDFVALTDKDTKGYYHGVFIEHCGSTTNFHEKRFRYIGTEDSTRLAIYKINKNNQWYNDGVLIVDRILYILCKNGKNGSAPKNGYSEKLIRTTPAFENECFLYGPDDQGISYESWKGDSSNSLPENTTLQNLFEAAKSKNDVVQAWEARP
jgi:hypothetical protein